MGCWEYFCGAEDLKNMGGEIGKIGGIGGNGGNRGVSRRSTEKSRRSTESFWGVVLSGVEELEGMEGFHGEAQRSRGGARRDFGELSFRVKKRE
ncbi:MAG: hypothetical protein AAGA77_07400 [Bacteroidota bacterium]